MYTLDIRVCTSQFIHCFARATHMTGSFFITFVYGFNDVKLRDQLWLDIQELALKIDEAWMILGDYNEILHQNERVGKKTIMKPSLSLRDCMITCQMEELKYSGSFYTWKNKQRPEDRVYSKIDRAMVNMKWTDQYPNSEQFFFLKQPFRCFRMWKEASSYATKVSTNWNIVVSGTEMYKLVLKLKRLKQIFREINREGYHYIKKAEAQAKHCMLEIQESLHQDPLNESLIQQEVLAREEFNRLNRAYLLFLAQKSKDSWVMNGDENTAIFHASLKARRIQNRIFSIHTEKGTWVDTVDGVQRAFLEYYQNLLGTQLHSRRKVSQAIVDLGPGISEVHSRMLLETFTAQEVKDALFSIQGLKAPCPDGYSSFFYQDNWDLVGAEVCSTVLDFLTTGKILKVINATTITLIPKIKCPTKVSDFRPISCCNVLYKIASKMICARLRRVLLDLIAENQGGFVHGSKKGIKARGSNVSIIVCVRVTLINAVLMSIHSYWAQIMILPKRILKEIDAICRAFLWRGMSDNVGPGLVAWHTVCNSKTGGGLGFKRVVDWNIEAIGKYIWEIASKKDNL
ncbi:uncharacterized protein LOC133815089 [Humulus lupulus]|uniref:uncharacterized protein LOC133815089 n=1 Tax=Humulus lupulus TaxID=3486 RepID=UPI002B4026C5|nr:uncharacterized protein LOC133815089 [Humulus lupulus]